MKRENIAISFQIIRSLTHFSSYSPIAQCTLVSGRFFEAEHNVPKPVVVLFNPIAFLDLLYKNNIGVFRTSKNMVLVLQTHIPKFGEIYFSKKVRVMARISRLSYILF